MRLDKFLWTMRYFKTRTIASEAIKKNSVWVNDSLAKPSKEVQIGDHIKIRRNQIHYSLEVIQFPKSRVGAKLVTLYIKDITTQEEYNQLELRKISQNLYRDKGMGRPTKRERRDLDDYLEEPD